jgi:hypothetical protein
MNAWTYIWSLNSYTIASNITYHSKYVNRHVNTYTYIHKQTTLFTDNSYIPQNHIKEVIYQIQKHIDKHKNSSTKQNIHEHITHAFNHIWDH